MKEAFRVWPLLENLTKVDNILFTQEVFAFPSKQSEARLWLMFFIRRKVNFERAIIGAVDNCCFFL